ncbi:DNA alkylation repair protein [Lysinibacter sp. HNR]|uniref:DNA alkylation repair protein n=1 Tax=Lysinibacter sp. HNR TaxID=3031408 RepID=UPI00243571AA|nr:DNA alkylation repair protein [Lysinibacter sp. HNR]WGD38289.1 DNA alkylation repair protein [Lysinibacter sp. HNR]
MAHQALILAIRDQLQAQADPVRAEGAQRYMKSVQPYYGVRVPVVRKIVSEAWKRYPCDSPEELYDTAQALWRSAAYREERYAAIDLTGLRMARGRLEFLPLFVEMIVTGAWWDLVDALARNNARLLDAHPQQMIPTVRAWSTDSDMWLRRSSVLSQLGRKKDTDRELLSEVILANTGDKEFFIRKAIGWALREYAKTDPEWVQQFVKHHQDSLSPLSTRESLKNM